MDPQTDASDRRARVIAGRYSLDREIGRGATGAVWVGRDEVLGREVALKRIGLLPGADHTDVARAEREARLGAQLNHAHVVAVFDIVAEPDAHWLVMEYVDGSTLAQLVSRQGRLSPDDAAPLLWQAADALVAAHAAGIAHRDVKPSNILVDRSGRVKLTDFGIARIATDAALTQTGLVTGSPAYLAPEVATGSRGDAAADVWSLGATAFHLLAGRPPYEIGDNVLGALYRIVHEEPPRLDDAGWLAPLLEGTMVREPTLRWTMSEVRDFLGDSRPRVAARSAAVAPEPVQATGDTRVLGTVPVAPAPAAPAAPAEHAAPQPGGTSAPRRPPTKALLAGLGLVLAVVLALVLVKSLSGGPTSGSGADRAGTSTGATSKPTAAGMEAFIRRYVATVASDPDTAWPMLTAKFQRESGGLDTYRRFWDRATNGRVLSITADPATLTVSYQVRFDHFHNGPGPTVLQLTFDRGRYRIDGERTKGFVPAG